MPTINVKNEGITNSQAYNTGYEYDIKGLLEREGVMEQIINMSSKHGGYDKENFKFYFENLCSKIYTCIKASRSVNGLEPFWEEIL